MSTESTGAFTLIDLEPTAADFRSEFIEALRRRPRRLPCKFFYDQRGSLLFDRICELPEYYPTRTELAILQREATAIAAFCGPACLLIELGSGSSRKTRAVLDRLKSPAGYVPIDISRLHLEQAAQILSGEYPGLEIVPVCADYAQTIRLPETAATKKRNVIFFPGSTIGNFEPAEATSFLRHVARWCEPGDRMIIGVDLQKPREHVEPAYNDAQGVTADFNKNLLVRANVELGANFDPQWFSHRAVYNLRHGRIEMLLVSRREQSIAIDGEEFTFGPNEEILTEYSYKYTPSRFGQVAADAGWRIVRRWCDSKGWFGVFALELRQAPKQ